MRYISTTTTIGVGDNMKTTKPRYNTIIGHPTSNVIKETLSTLYPALKYLLENKQVCIVKGDYEITTNGNSPLRLITTVSTS